VNQNNTDNKLTNWELVSINPASKNWTWQNLFCFWGNSIQGIIGFSLIASLYLVHDLNILIVFTGSLTAGFLVLFFSNLIGNPSQKHGIPFPVLLRLSMGVNGAKYIALLRGIIAIFMFGVQTYFLSKSFGYLIRIAVYIFDSSFLDKEIFALFFIGLNFIDFLSLFMTLLLQVFLFSRGANFNKIFINFSAIFVYFGLLFFSIIIFSYNSEDLISSFLNLPIFYNIFEKDTIIPFLTIVGTMFAYFSIIIVNFGDFSRYVKNKKELSKGNLSLIFNLVLFSFFAVFIVLGADIILSENSINAEKILTSPTDIIGKFDNTFLTIIVLIFILFASLSTNLIANFIPSQNCLINLLPNSLNLKSASFFIGFIAFFIGAFWVSVLSQIGILSIIDTLGAFLGPIFGIVVVDYYLVKKEKIINKDLFSSNRLGIYYYSGGWHLRAIYSLFIAFIFAASTIWNIELRFLQPFSWIIGFFISSIIYYLLSNR